MNSYRFSFKGWSQMPQHQYEKKGYMIMLALLQSPDKGNSALKRLSTITDSTSMPRLQIIY